MAKKKNEYLGGLTLLRTIRAEGLIFKGEGTRLISKFTYDNKNEHYNNFYQVIYQVKSGGKYIDLFFIYHNTGRNTYRVVLKDKVTSKGNSIGPREEKILSKLNKKKIAEDKNFYITTYSYFTTNPIQFCTIPFLEDEVKNWILTAGQQTYSEKDFKAMAKSLIS